MIAVFGFVAPLVILLLYVIFVVRRLTELSCHWFLMVRNSLKKSAQFFPKKQSKSRMPRTDKLTTFPCIGETHLELAHQPAARRVEVVITSCSTLYLRTLGLPRPAARCGRRGCGCPANVRR
jgi:hypothetical protein